MTLTKKQFSQIVFSHFAPIMKEYGFKWQSSNHFFIRNLGEIQQSITFKQNQFYHSQFTPILEIASRKLAKFKKRKVYYIDHFKPGSIPEWYKLESDLLSFDIGNNNSEEILAILTQKVIQLGIPFLDHFSSLQSTINYYLSKVDYITRRNVVIDICLITENIDYARRSVETFSKYRKSKQSYLPDYSLENMESKIIAALAPLLEQE